MAKLPKKSTMIETSKRVKGYAYKMYTNGRLSIKEFTDLSKSLDKLIDRIKK
ncbi:MAG: hypothetical protein ACTSR2_04925 [Candidatus Hodarchaeales archaeon]